MKLIVPRLETVVSSGCETFETTGKQGEDTLHPESMMNRTFRKLCEYL